MMMKKIFAPVLAVLLLVQMLTPFTFAQETGTVVDLPDLEVCSLPRQDYQDFNNFRLAYQAAVVDADPILAQDHFTSMDAILAAHCDTLASIVQVQSEDLTDQCDTIMNHLLAKNNYYITMGRSQEAIATQGLIQTVFQTQDCASIIQPASELAIDIVEQEMLDNQTIDLSLEVIPYKENICFNDYGPSHTFKEQVNSIQDLTVATSVLDTVSSYFNQLGSVAVDAIQQKREGTLLAYAKNLLGFKKDGLRNIQYKTHILPFQTQEVVSLLDSIVGSNAITALDSLGTNYMPDIGIYLEKFVTYPLRATFAEPRTQNIFDSFVAQPIVLIRDDTLGEFTQTIGDKGLSLVIPQLVVQVPDPLDPAVMLEQVQREELVINVIDIQGTSQMLEVTDDTTGELVLEEQYLPSKILADIWYAGEKVSGLDVDIEHDAAGDLKSLELAWYLDPYIYTNTFTKNITTNAAGVEQEDVTMDIRIFGPEGCGVQFQIDTVTIIDPTGSESSTQNITFVLNNTRIELQTVDIDAMIEDIQTYRQTVPAATSTPQTDSYLVDAKIYHKGVYRAYLYPEFDTWRVGFVSQQSSQDFIAELWNPTTIGAFANMDVIMTWWDILSALSKDAPATETTPDDTQIVLQDLQYCIDDQDNISDGYYYYPAQDVMVSTYCSSEYDSCGTYQYTVDSLDLYYRRNGIDATCVNIQVAQPDDTKGDTKGGSGSGDTDYGSGDTDYGSGDTGYGSGDQTGSGTDTTPEPEAGTGDNQSGSQSQQIPGCTNTAATNYNSGATADDGSCTLPQSGPIVGCPDPSANNYVEGSDENDEFSRSLCEY